MTVLRKILGDPTFVAHGVGMLGVVGTAIAGLSPVFGGIIAALTAVFHVAQTFGNGTAVPPGWQAADRSSAVSADGAAFGEPHVDAPAPVLNAAGTTELKL